MNILNQNYQTGLTTLKQRVSNWSTCKYHRESLN